MAQELGSHHFEERLSQPQCGVRVDKDVYVRMRDGVRVAVDVYRPDIEGRFPALYASSPYQKDHVYLPAIPIFHKRETNDIEWFVRRGYAYVHADIRGTGKSVEGEWRFHSFPEQNDHYDLIEWIAAQPWCSGRVGMIGESYYGWTQWFAAATQPPHLATIVPFDAGADMYRDVIYHGGLLNSGFLTWWHCNLRANHLLDEPGPYPPDQLRWDMVYEVLRHPFYDEFWLERTADFKKIRVPVYSIGIWHKVHLHLRGNLCGFEQLEVPKKLLVCDGNYLGDEMAIFHSPEMKLELLRWYDHWLKGNDTGIMNEPPVKLFIRSGDTGYRDENEWPIARAEYTRFYLQPGPAGAVTSLNDGGLSTQPPPAGAASFEYEYPSPNWRAWKTYGTAPVINGVPHPTMEILTYSSEPLQEDLEVTGPIYLVLYASSTQKDTDFYVRLVDQAPDKEQQKGAPPKGRILTRGWLRASHRELDSQRSSPRRPFHSHSNPSPIEPGKIYRYDIEVLPTSNLFRKDHRIRIDLSNGDSPVFDLGGHHYGIKMGKDTIYHDGDHPSHIVLPIIPAGSPSKD